MNYLDEKQTEGEGKKSCLCLRSDKVFYLIVRLLRHVRPLYLYRQKLASYIHTCIIRAALILPNVAQSITFIFL